MKLSIREKKVLYAFACPNHHNTVTRLKWLTALTVDPQAKHQMLELARKMENGDGRKLVHRFLSPAPCGDGRVLQCQAPPAFGKGERRV